SMSVELAKVKASSNTGPAVFLANTSRDIDSGATHACTYDASDCTNVRQCSMSVTAAGNVFDINLIGTAIIDAVNSLGQPQRITIDDCLISDRFPYKLLALQSFTNKGHISVTGNEITITNPVNNIKLMPT